jgi:hypothetical protein
MAFKKGVSGNPGGRKAMPKALELKLSKILPEAFDEIIDLMRNAKDEGVRLKAANIIIERQLGKPVQPIGNEDEKKPFKIIIEPG